MKSHSARALPFTVLLLLSVVLSSCATGCPPACLGERIGSVDWSGRNLSGGVLVNTAARQSSLNNVDFSGADLSGMDISGASMKAADLTDSILIGTDLENAYLSGAVFTRANLTGANLG
ncbi:MAG TPA: pentapeptide repeat-containing protein, partial [Anaerolineaceae bacterium]|nr:pentapeptide repeat-containing protein [Anaerolineaceae bacterium]